MTTSQDPAGRLDVPDAAWRALTPARLRAELSVFELHLRFIALGGYTTLDALSQHCSAGVALAGRKHDLIVLALNERFLELRSSERLPYTG
ncbi:MAG: hypothetical protein R2755_21255 [Acidimicrobiales bacterium]